MNQRYLLIAVLIVTACDQQKFKIGINGGAAGADVARMAASEIRQSRPAVGRRVEIRAAAMKAVVRDSATPQMIALSLDSIADDKSVGVIISRFLDNDALEAARRLSAKQVPFIATTPLPAGIASRNGPGFSMVPGYNKQAQFLAGQAKAGDRVAIVYLNNFYGNTLNTALIDALRARGITPVDVRKYEQSWDEPRMVALGTELEKTRDPHLVFFLGRAPSLELVWQPFREAYKEIRVIGSDLVESTAIYNNPEGRFTGLLYVRHFDPKSEETRMKDLQFRYDMYASRGQMTGEMVMIYDAMHITAEALRSGARTQQEIRDYFTSLGRTRPAYNGVGGPVAFDDNGESDRKFRLAFVTRRGVVNAEDSLKVVQ
jgi:ABC-type branched-subunit amino acid transport system substrate-binding protein